MRLWGPPVDFPMKGAIPLLRLLRGVVNTSDGKVVRAFHRFTLVDQTGESSLGLFGLGLISAGSQKWSRCRPQNNQLGGGQSTELLAWGFASGLAQPSLQHEVEWLAVSQPCCSRNLGVLAPRENEYAE
eukprot:1143238-Pelagomonas_calceolata.AAC.3